MKSLVGLSLGAAALVGMAFTTPSFAGDRNVKFGARAGTWGYGGEVGLQLHKRFNVRAVMSGAQVNVIEELDDIEFDITADLGAAGVQADLFPLFAGVYLTGGVFSNASNVTLTAMPNEGLTLGPFDINGVEIPAVTYTAEEVGRLDGTIEFEDVATYVGLGWTGRVPLTMLELFAEGGAYFQGDAVVRYEASGLAAQDPQFLADLAAEAQLVEDELNQFGFTPAVNLGLRLRF